MSNKVLNLDFSKDPILPAIVYGRVGDDLLQTVTVNLTRENAPVDLTGGTITFEGITSKNQSKVFDPDNISSNATDLAKGSFDYTFPSAAFSVSGQYEVAYFSFLKDGKRDTSSNFEVIVLNSADISVEQAETIITEYDKLVAELQAKFDDSSADLTTEVANAKAEMQANLDAFETSISDALTPLLTTIQTAIANFQSQIDAIQSQMDDLTANGAITRQQADARYLKIGDASAELVTDLDENGLVASDPFEIVPTDSSTIFKYSHFLSLIRPGGTWTTETSALLLSFVSSKGNSTYAKAPIAINGDINQMELVVNVLTALTNKFGADFFANKGLTTTADQIAYVNANFHGTAFATGFGSGQGGNSFSTAVYNNSTSTYDLAVSHAQSANADLEISIGDLTNYVDGDGNVYIIMYSLPASSTVASSMTLDYVALQLSELVPLKSNLQDSLDIPVLNISDWTALSLNSGVVAADSTTPQYRITNYVIKGVVKKYVEFRGAVTGTSGTFPSSSTQTIVSVLATELTPLQTEICSAQTNKMSTQGRVTITTAGNLYVGQDSGSAVDYIYINGFGYWLD